MAGFDDSDGECWEAPEEDVEAFGMAPLLPVVGVEEACWDEPPVAVHSSPGRSVALHESGVPSPERPPARVRAGVRCAAFVAQAPPQAALAAVGGGATSAPSASDGAGVREASEAAPKRRRLTRKSPVFRVGPRSPADVLRDAQAYFDCEEDCEEETPAAVVTHRTYERLRALHVRRCQQAVGNESKRQEESDADYEARRRAQRSTFGQLPLSEKLALAKALAEAEDQPREIRQRAWALARHMQATLSMSQGQESRQTQTKSLMVTYNGPWGVVDDDTVAELPEDVEAATERLREHVVVQFLRRRLARHVAAVERQFPLKRWAWALELCTTTWEEERRVRVHAHVFVVSTKAFRLRSGFRLAFGGVVGHRSEDALSQRGRGRNQLSQEVCAMYYLAAPKRGVLAAHANQQAGRDYVINSEWITSMWQQGKLTDTAAMEEYVRCKKDVRRLCQNVRDQQDLRRETELAKTAAAMAQRLAGMQLAFVEVPAVTAWLERQSKVSWRQPFLVLTGPSGLGKTQYAVSLRGRSHTLEVNCAAAVEEPDLRGFKSGQHRAVLFDEAHAEMIIKQKKLFQAPASMIQMAPSKTNCHGYSIYVHGVLLIVCSNTWPAEVDAATPDDRAWLLANSVVVHVEKPLWVQ